MTRLNPRERTLALVLLVVLAGVLLFQWVIRPLQTRLALAHETLDQQSDFIARAQAESMGLYEIEADIARLQQAAGPLLISGEPVPEMIRWAEAAAKTANISQMDIRPLGTDRADNLLRHRLQLEVSADFPVLKDFLYHLEADGRPLLLERIDINSDNQRSNYVRSTVLVAAYTMPPGGENEK